MCFTATSLFRIPFLRIRIADLFLYADDSLPTLFFVAQSTGAPVSGSQRTTCTMKPTATPLCSLLAEGERPKASPILLEPTLSFLSVVLVVVREDMLVNLGNVMCFRSEPQRLLTRLSCRANPQRTMFVLYDARSYDPVRSDKGLKERMLVEYVCEDWVGFQEVACSCEAKSLTYQ